MVEDKTIVRVRNLTDHSVGYISFENRRRNLAPQQYANVTAEELRQLAFTTGGAYLIKNSLSISNKELALELGVDPEIIDYEYTWTKKDVVRLLRQGTEDELADALDFAPEGIVDMIIDEAIKMELPDLTKRDMISKAVGTDLNSKIQNYHNIKRDTEPAAQGKSRERRVKKEGAAEASVVEEPKRQRKAAPQASIDDGTDEEVSLFSE